MSEFISIEIDDKYLRQALNRFTDKCSDLTPLMQNIAGALEDSVEENFENEGHPKWKELAAFTIKQSKEKGYWPGRILQMRGELASSITSSYDSNSAIVGTNKVYAAIHQFGGKAGRIKKVKILARPYLKITNENTNYIKSETVKYLN